MNENLSVPPPEDVLERVRYRPSGFNPVEARIAAAVLEDPTRVSRESIVSFARRTSVSTGSVVRFAKLLGMTGFQDLKLAIAEAAARGGTDTAVRPGTTRLRAALDVQSRAIALAADVIDATTVEEAAFVLARAPRIDIIAAGATAAVAHSLLFSLTLMGLHVRFLADTAEQGAAAAFLGEGDCLIAISVSGRTRSIVDGADRAKAAGATVIALTCDSRAPLLKHASLQLVLDKRMGHFETEWPLRTGLSAIARALVQYVSDHLPDDELRQRRKTWSTGRFGLRYS